MLRKATIGILIFSALFASHARSEESRAKKFEAGFVSIFNGNDLSGWHMMGPQTWSAKDGIMSCSGGGHGWIRTDAQYEDFVVRLEYKFGAGGNSGVFLRSAKDGDPSYTGMQIQTYDDFGKAPAVIGSGALVDAVPPRVVASKPADEWNQMQIACIGSMVTVWLNGVRVLRVDLNDPVLNAGLKANAKLNNRNKIGYIGLQNHNMPVYYRNISIRKVE